MSRPGIELPLVERQAHIMSLLRANPRGMRVADIAKALKLGVCRTGEILRTLRKQGLALPSADGGSQAVWSTPERVVVIRRLIRDRRRARALVRERRHQRELEQARQEREWLRIEQRCVPASKASPITITAPISVFHLAA